TASREAAKACPQFLDFSAISNPKVTPINYVIEYINFVSSEADSLFLCFEVLNNIKNCDDEFSKFIAIKILEKHVQMYEKLLCKIRFTDHCLPCGHNIIEVILKVCKKELHMPKFVMNALVALVSHLFLRLFPMIVWADFFHTLSVLINISPTGVEYYLRIIYEIDQEIQMYYAQKNEIYSNMDLIKNKMKECFIPEFIHTLIQISNHYVVEGNKDLVNLSLSVFSSYIAW
ncbi:hypothetical protein MXB_3511, partial [Myxobolus squamalis]